MVFNPTAVAVSDGTTRTPEHRAALAAVTTADMEPYRDLLVRFVQECPAPGMGDWQINALINDPRGFAYSTPKFAWWLVTNDIALTDTPTPNPEPFTVEPTPDAWAPYRDALIAYIPNSNFTYFDIASIDAIINTRRDNYSWLLETGGPNVHPFLTEFLNAVNTGRAPRPDITTEVTTPTIEPYTVDELRVLFSSRGRDMALDRYAPWHDTIRRWARSDATTYLDAGRTDETEPERQDTLGHMLTHPVAYPGSGPEFLRWLREHGQTTPDPADGTVPSGDTVVVDHRHTLEFWVAQPDFDRVFHSLDREWMRTFAARFDDYTRDTGYAGDYLRDFVGNPGGTTLAIKRFFRWMIANPVTTTPEVTPTPTIEEAPVTTTAPLRDRVIGLLDTPMHEWPRDVREALAPEIARYHHITDGGRSLEDARTNSDYALLFETSGSSTWTRSEFSVHTRFRRDVVNGSFVITYPDTPEVIPTYSFDFDITLEYLGAHRVEILTANRAQFMQWARETDTGSNTEEPGGWRDFMVTGNTNDRYWRDNDWTEGPRYLRAFLTWAREHRDLFLTTPPETTTTDTAVPSGDTTTATEPRVIPIGPEHPGFQEFAERLAKVATDNGMCPEYDRIARAVGLPTRKSRSTYRVTLEVTVDHENNHRPDDRALREAAAALVARPGTITARAATHVKTDQIVAS